MERERQRVQKKDERTIRPLLHFIDTHVDAQCNRHRVRIYIRECVNIYRKHSLSRGYRTISMLMRARACPHFNVFHGFSYGGCTMHHANALHIQII